MDIASFDALLSSNGQAVLRAAAALQPCEVDFLKHFQALSRQYPAELARPALEIAILRHKATDKFPASLAANLYLTREALEQATSYEVAAYRAERYRTQINPTTVLDLGCSVGSDTMALASVAPTLGIDRDLLRLRMAAVNFETLSKLAGEIGQIHPCRFLQANLDDPLPIAVAPGTALFFDPARRADQRRIFSVDDYQPPLSTIAEWLPRFPALGVKLSPGVDLAELAGYQAEVEFISLQGELKECVLWFGALRSAKRRATLLPSRAQLSTDEPGKMGKPAVRISRPLSYLYEPDPAILRAGLVRLLAEQIDAWQLDPEIAYLTSEQLSPTPFARAWEIETWFPFQLKRLRAYLREQGIGRVTVKKRGSPLEPEALIRSLKLTGDRERVLVLTHWDGKPIVLICIPPGLSQL